MGDDFTHYGCTETIVANKSPACPNHETTLRMYPIGVSRIPKKHFVDILEDLEDLNRKLVYEEQEYQIDLNSVRYEITRHLHRESAISAPGEISFHHAREIEANLERSAQKLRENGYGYEAEILDEHATDLHEVIDEIVH